MAHMKINHKSDFKLTVGYTDGSSIIESPFSFTFYTNETGKKYIAKFDGTEFSNCLPTDDGRVKIPFDNHNLGAGTLHVIIELSLNDSDFSDGKYNYFSDDTTDIILSKGSTDIVDTFEVFVNKPTTKGIGIALIKPYTVAEVPEIGRIHYLGEFNNNNEAWDAAAQPEIFGNKDINIIAYDTIQGSNSYLIFQNHSSYQVSNTHRICTQYLFYEGGTRASYMRTFDVDAKELMHGWQPIHLYTSFVVENGRVYGITTPNDLNSKLHKKVALFDIPSLTNAVTTDTQQTITGQKQFNGDVSISGKSLITRSIDPGELTVFPQVRNTNNGLIIRTANRSDSIPNVEILATNNQQSYKYEFPKKSGVVVTGIKIGSQVYTANIVDGVIDLSGVFS